MTHLLLVGLGGFLGAAMRYLVSGWVTTAFGPSFPAGTLVVNLLGCLAIGVLGGLGEARQLLTPGARLSSSSASWAGSRPTRRSPTSRSSSRARASSSG